MSVTHPILHDTLTVCSQYGASLSYLSSDASCGAASPQILADMVVPSDTEFVIMTDRECNGDCGFVRPGSVAYRKYHQDSFTLQD